MVKLGVGLRFMTGLKVWFRGETQGKQAGGLLVCVMCRGLAMVCRGLCVCFWGGFFLCLKVSRGMAREGPGPWRQFWPEIGF